MCHEYTKVRRLQSIVTVRLVFSRGSIIIWSHKSGLDSAEIKNPNHRRRHVRSIELEFEESEQFRFFLILLMTPLSLIK